MSKKKLFLKPGDLVVYKSSAGNLEQILLRDNLTWSELRGKVLDGEVCVVLEIEKEVSVDVPDVKILDSRGSVGWALARYFKLIQS